MSLSLHPLGCSSCFPSDEPPCSATHTLKVGYYSLHPQKFKFRINTWYIVIFLLCFHLSLPSWQFSRSYETTSSISPELFPREFSEKKPETPPIVPTLDLPAALQTTVRHNVQEKRPEKAIESSERFKTESSRIREVERLTALRLEDEMKKAEEKIRERISKDFEKQSELDRLARDQNEQSLEEERKRREEDAHEWRRRNEESEVELREFRERAEMERLRIEKERAVALEEKERNAKEARKREAEDKALFERTKLEIEEIKKRAEEEREQRRKVEDEKNAIEEEKKRIEEEKRRVEQEKKEEEERRLSLEADLRKSQLDDNDTKNQLQRSVIDLKEQVGGCNSYTFDQMHTSYIMRYEGFDLGSWGTYYYLSDIS